MVHIDGRPLTRCLRMAITLHENEECPALCAVTHFLALAFADNAFLSEELTPENIRSLRPQDGRAVLWIGFRPEVESIPVFRTSQRVAAGVQVDPRKALTASTITKWLRRLGQGAGFEHRLTGYSLRRETGTRLTGSSSRALSRRGSIPADSDDRNRCQ